MVNAIVSFLIAILLIQFLFVAPGFGQTLASDEQTAKIKARLAKRGTGEKAKVKIELGDGSRLKGWIAALESDDFVLADAKTGERRRLAYRDVAKVKKQGLSPVAKLGIAGAILGAVAITVIAVGVKNLDDDIFPK